MLHSFQILPLGEVGNNGDNWRKELFNHWQDAQHDRRELTEAANAHLLEQSKHEHRHMNADKFWGKKNQHQRLDIILQKQERTRDRMQRRLAELEMQEGLNDLQEHNQKEQKIFAAITAEELKHIYDSIDEPTKHESIEEGSCYIEEDEWLGMMIEVEIECSCFDPQEYLYRNLEFYQGYEVMSSRASASNNEYFPDPAQWQEIMSAFFDGKDLTRINLREEDEKMYFPGAFWKDDLDIWLIIESDAWKVWLEKRARRVG